MHPLQRESAGGIHATYRPLFGRSLYMIESPPACFCRDERDVGEPQVDRVVEDVGAPHDHPDRDAAHVGVLPFQNSRRSVKVCEVKGLRSAVKMEEIGAVF